MIGGLLAGLVAGLAFAIGYAIRRGSICAVVAARMLVVDRRSTRMRAFGLAAAAAGAIILPLHWLAPDAVGLSVLYPVTWTVLAGGIAFGLGARMNDACALGTLAHLTGGDLDYSFTVLGMVAGATLIAGVAGIPTPDPNLSPMATPTPLSTLVALAFAATAVLTLQRRARRWLRELRRPGIAHFGPFRAMLVIGVCGGLLYALAGGWTYMSVLTGEAIHLAHPTAPAIALPALMAAVLLVAGGFAAAVRTGTFRLRAPTLRQGARCLAGGLLMGGAAATIPGGNGALLVHGIPSLAPHAIAAYAAMTGLLCLSFLRSRPS